MKYATKSITLIVALHELIGHGTGKFFTEVSKGNFNFPKNLTNPFTGNPINTYYTSKETFDSKFGSIHIPYEECRADTIALYFLHFDEPYEIFFPNLESEVRKDIYYVAWMCILK